MKRRVHSLPITAASAVLCLLFAHVPAAFAQAPVVLNAIIYRSLNQVVIGGQDLQPASGSPTVTLNGVQLVVASFNAANINADLPPALGAGTFLLVVGNGSGTDTFAVTSPIVGPEGPAGPRGLKGATGAAGPQGSIGPTGTQGPLGPTGSQGPAGPQGVIGLQGPAGPAGSLTLPYSGTASGAAGAAFGILQTYAGATGILGTAGPGGIGLYGDGGPGNSQSLGSGIGGIFSGGGLPGDGFVGGDAIIAYPGSDGVGIFAYSGVSAYPTAGTNTVAGIFDGDVQVTGNLSKSGGSFQIDHPLDPANQYLYHSFVESPDMMNVYNGNIVTDGGGNATITLPKWFEALNRDFRYQLTSIGQPAQAWVASKVSNNSFSIKTDKPNVEVSWQVTGIRQDAWANAHRIPTEAAKAPVDRGQYLHPELFGHDGEPSIAQSHHPLPKRLERSAGDPPSSR